MKTRSQPGLFFASALALLLLANAIAYAQEAVDGGPPSGSAAPVVEAIDTKLQAIEADPKLTDSQKAFSKDVLQRAKEALQAANDERAQSQQFSEMVSTVSERSGALNETLNQPAEASKPIADDATVESLSQEIASINADLQRVTTRSTELAGEPARRRARHAEIPTSIVEAQRALDEVKNQLTQPAPANESPAESAARETLLRARGDELAATIERLNQEQSAYLATSDLLALEQKVLDQQLIQLNQKLKLLQDALVEKQTQLARDTTAALEKTVDAVPQSLRELANKNLELAQTQSRLISESSSVEQILADVLAAAGEVAAELESSQTRVETVGLTDALGLMFRERRQDFEEMRSRYRPRTELTQTIEQYQLESFRLEDELDDIKRELAESEAPSLDWRSEDIAWEELSETDAEWVLLRKRQELIENTLQTQNDVLQTMLTSDTRRRQLLLEIDRFNDFVDTHLFWTRSAPVLSLKELKSASAALEWLTDRENWNAAAYQMLSTARSHPLQSFLLLSLLVAVFYARPRFRRTIVSEGKEAHRFNARYSLTLHSLAATVGAAAASPVLFAVPSFLFLASPNGNPFVIGLGHGLAVTALFIASREFLKEVCRNDGLADAHFGWSKPVRSHLKRNLRWYTWIGGAIIFFLVLYHEHPDELVRTFSTRYCATTLFLLTAAFHHVILGDRSPIYADLVRSNSDSLFYRWRKLIWTVAVLFPIAFAMMSLGGYLETVFRLGRSLQSTFLLLVIVVVLLGLMARWLTLHRRDITRRKTLEARDRRLAAESISETSKKVASEAGIVLEDEQEMDLPGLDHQTRQVIFIVTSLIAMIGLAYIWSDLVPAFAYFDEIQLGSVGTGENVEHVTVKDVLYSIFCVAFVFFAVNNLPSMLELLVLSRTSLDSGARYAIATLLRYALIVVGVLIVLELLSLPYHQLGWLIAAISVGLGFGLQEIVANFVSGIILLLERPVRVGDVVTIDDTTGIVSRIQMRATTVTNWDRKELVIPNKDLITQKLLNWSLSNVVNRLTLNVGVSYGSDTNQVRQILQQVVSAHPDVLSDPPPLINFDTFGDSSLNFVVRFFLPKLDNRIEVTHQINTAIAEEFEKAGISIPFPQRDVHLFKADSET